MPFSKEDKVLTNNLHRFKKIRFTEDSDGIFEDKLQKGKLDILLKRFGKHEAPTTGTRATDQSTRVLKRT